MDVLTFTSLSIAFQDVAMTTGTAVATHCVIARLLATVGIIIALVDI